jgi:hypothetical protein
MLQVGATGTEEEERKKKESHRLIPCDLFLILA